jgi:hypothetical protein
MADDFRMSEDGGSKVYSKQGELCGIKSKNSVIQRGVCLQSSWIVRL